MFNGYEELALSDHHIYTIDDLKNILKKFNQLRRNDRILLTTEKDAVRSSKIFATAARATVLRNAYSIGVFI